MWMVIGIGVWLPREGLAAHQEQHIDRLRAVLPDGRVTTDPDVMEGYRRDHAVSPVPVGTPLAVVTARSAAEVPATLRWATENRVPVVPRGAGTSVVGGATAIDGRVVLSLARMNAIREISPEDEIAVAEAGVINADLDRAARARGLMYAPDPASLEMPTIGGNLATNAGGFRCVKYGVTRDSVLGVEAVLADGRIIKAGRRTIKGVVGYDLTGLLVGSEGTLAVITSATLRLRQATGTPATVAASFPSPRAAVQAVSSIIASGIRPSMLELMDRTMLEAVDDWKHHGLEPGVNAMLIAQSDAPAMSADAAAIAKLCQQAGAREVALSSSKEESDQLLEIRRVVLAAIQRLCNGLGEDICVPRSKLAEMFERMERAAAAHNVIIGAAAHAGDGNIHPWFGYDLALTQVPPQVWAAADEVFRAALELGGTLTGEHGVGLLKQRWLRQELGDDLLDVHHTIKRALDPHGILNPGKAIHGRPITISKLSLEHEICPIGQRIIA